MRNLIANSGLTELFDGVAGRDSAANRKPAPEGLQQLAELFGVSDMREVLVIGDSDVDHQSARNAGTEYLHAGWSEEPNTVAQRLPERVIKRPEHLVSILRDEVLRDEDAVRAWSGKAPDALTDAIDKGDLGWFAGAGVSIPSGLGSWETDYLPMLAHVGLGWMTNYHDLPLPEVLQLGCTEVQTAQALFDSFQRKFGGTYKPNGYHLAMVRSRVPRIWTSNYDQLFERAISNTGVSGIRTVCHDKALLDHFQTGNLVIKVNGDFEKGAWDDQLDWQLVATQEQFDKADKRRPEI